MNMKKFCFVGALTVAALFPLSTILPQNNIDLNSSYLYENHNQEQMKDWLKEDRAFVESLFPDNIHNLQIFVHNDKTIINKILQTIYRCAPDDYETQECQNLNGYSSYFTTQRYELSFVNNIVIGQKIIDQDYGQISDFLQDKRKLLDIVFFHEFGHYLLMNNAQEANKFIEQNHLKLEDAALLNESFADTFSIAMMHYKYPELDIEKLKESVIQYRLAGIVDNPTHQTYPALMDFKIPDTKDLDKLLEVCLESSKQTFFTINSQSSTFKNQDKSIKDNIQDIRNKNTAKSKSMHLL